VTAVAVDLREPPERGPAEPFIAPPRVWITVGALALAVAAGVLVGQLELLGAALVVGALAAVAIVVWPHLAVYAYLLLLPFVSGIPRGHLLPLLRVTEMAQIALTAAALARLVIHLVQGRRLRLPRSAVLWAFALLAWAGSAGPIVWLLARGLPVTPDDLLAAVPMWKYLALFVLVAATVRTPAQVRTCLLLSVAVGVVTGVVATLQALDLFGLPALMARYWAEDVGPVDLGNGRGSGFLGSPIATATYVAFNLAIVLALLVHRARWRPLLAAAALVLTVSAFGIGQVTGILALLVIGIALGALTGRLGLLALIGAVVLPLAAVAVWPVLRLRVMDSSSWVPRSWTVRWDNLQQIYLPEIGRDYQWVLGVRPNSTVPAPEIWRDVIYLESGYLWLLWVGGIPFLAAFVHFARTALAALGRVARSRTDAVGSAAVAAWAALAAISVLTVIDMHLTMRGEADLAYILLALGLVGGAGSDSDRRPVPEAG